MKTQVLVTIHYMELGGAEMSLLGLLESLDYSKYEVDLFVYSHRGELLRHIPPQVHLLPEIPEYAQVERPLREVVRDGYFRIALARLRAKWQHTRYTARKHPKDGSAIYSAVARNVGPLLPPICPGKEYDFAVSYLSPHDFVLQKVRSKQKVCWIHTDYSQIDVDTERELPVWAGYDRIVAISGQVKEAFLSVFPSLKDRIVIWENRLPATFIREQAEKMSEADIEKEMPRATGTVNLLSVGRFCAAKNYDNVPSICRRINEIMNPRGIQAVWYLIGFGSEEALIRERITNDSLPGQVVILGKKDNPYPYMKACDLYVQPSRYEGSPMTVLEARLLGRPVILTKFPTAGSVAGEDKGISIVPMDKEACAAGIASYLNK